ncbi:MAG: hypothetical protein GNW80_10915 [Asgard group archaeon]|nr:hypothetical protein [Asgard group archaeon]
MSSKKTLIPTGTVKRIMKETTGMMISDAFAEDVAQKATEFIVTVALKTKVYADHHKKRILKKSMYDVIELAERMNG